MSTTLFGNFTFNDGGSVHVWLCTPWLIHWTPYYTKRWMHTVYQLSIPLSSLSVSQNRPCWFLFERSDLHFDYNIKQGTIPCIYDIFSSTERKMFFLFSTSNIPKSTGADLLHLDYNIKLWGSIPRILYVAYFVPEVLNTIMKFCIRNFWIHLLWKTVITSAWVV